MLNYSVAELRIITNYANNGIKISYLTIADNKIETQ